MNLNTLRLLKNRIWSIIISSKEKYSFSEAGLIYEYFKKLPSENKLMLDVGAHHGESFIPYENLKWKIYAFEPDNKNREEIKFNPTFTELFDFAISNKDDDEVSFYNSDQSTGISGLSNFHPTHSLSQKVKTKTLRTFCEQNNVENIAFLKIDTEGYDLNVLKGLDFNNYHPELILCEFEDFKTKPLGYNYKDLGNFLLDKNYVVYISEWAPIVKYGVSHTWKTIKSFPENNLDNEMGWGNFIAVDPSIHKSFNKTLKKYLKLIKNN